MSLIICVFLCLRKISGLKMDGERKGFYLCSTMHSFPCSISCKDIWGWFLFMVKLLYMNARGNLKPEWWYFLLKQCWGTHRNGNPSEYQCLSVMALLWDRVTGAMSILPCWEASHGSQVYNSEGHILFILVLRRLKGESLLKSIKQKLITLSITMFAITSFLFLWTVFHHPKSPATHCSFPEYL